MVAPALSDEMVKTKAIVDLLSARGEWEDKYLVKVDDLEGKLKIYAVILAHAIHRDLSLDSGFTCRSSWLHSAELPYVTHDSFISFAISLATDAKSV